MWTAVELDGGDHLRNCHRTFTPRTGLSWKLLGSFPAMEPPNVGIPEPLASRMSMPEQHEYLRAKHARPKVSRRSALAGGLATAGAAGAGGLLLGSGTASAGHAPAALPGPQGAPATAK